MPRPKRVAIIGAGPSGLVTAKTLLHNYPEGTFAPTIFEKNHVLGGLWSVGAAEDGIQHGHRKEKGKRMHATEFVSSSMPTNLSRFSVCFSDLAWESVEGLGGREGEDVPMFPRAWQVGKYLEAYAKAYVPREVLKFGCRVVRTMRETSNRNDGRASWTVEWVQDGDRDGEEENDQNRRSGKPHGNGKVHSACFDFLVVASGYFSRPYIHNIPGLTGFQDRVIHSSALRDVDDLLSTSISTGGKLVVIGGSMSGAEAASSLALHLSSSAHAPGLSSQRWKGYTVHHISTRPFWCVPTYLPYLPKVAPESSQQESFLPLDLVMYDLSRRPPGQIEYSIGLLPPERSLMINDYFKSLLGSDQSDLGGGNLVTGTETEKTRPPWVAVSDSYAEYVRSGAVDVTIGRLSAVECSPISGCAKLNIRLATGEQTTLDDVAAIVLATGFTPFDSLSLLPADVLSLLEYSPEDTFLPIILDGKGCTHSDIPDLGFIGLYRGPYWGVMEMQARSLAQHWASDNNEQSSASLDKVTKDAEERQYLRQLRHTDSDRSRAQFPMGDYVGLMESFARDLGISRFEIPGLDERSGPVVPARYMLSSLSSCDEIKRVSEAETAVTLDSLQAVLSNQRNIARKSAANAIFRALHGRWRFERRNYSSRDKLDATGSSASVPISGTATFHPRYPSSQEYEKEYLYEELEIPNSESAPISQARHAESRTRLIYRLRNFAQNSSNDYIHLWSVDLERDPNAAQSFMIGLELEPFSEKGEFRACARRISDASRLPTYIAADAGENEDQNEYQYVFHLQGVNISSWELLVYDCSGIQQKGNMSDEGSRKINGPDPSCRQLWSRTRYER